MIQKAESVRIIKFRILVLHIGALAVVFFPLNTELAILTAVSVLIRVFGVEAGLHRYFAHRSYRTSRIFQFLLALLGSAAGFRGPLWWADVHRAHHQHADTDADPHPPKRSFMYAHLLWVFDPRNQDTDLVKVGEFACFKELVWLNKYHYVSPYAYAALLFGCGQIGLFGDTIDGYSAVVWGFFFATFVCLHSVLAVNSLCHGGAGDWFGSRRFATKDRSRNSLLIALMTVGGGWHNNHHRYPASAQAGFYPHEIDLAYYVLRVLERLGIVWDLKHAPLGLREQGKRGAAEQV